MKYNYVIVGCGGYYSVGYHDIMSLDNVKYFSSMKEGVDSKFSLMIQRLTFSEQVNRLVSYPFASYTYPRLFPFHFKEERPLVFIFFGNTQYVYQSTYLDYLRKRYPEAKFVLYMQDVIARNFKLNFESVRDKFDLILSYDKRDCNKYGLVYHPTPYSMYSIPENNAIEPFDVFYCGSAKTKARYEAIFDMYNKCHEQGLKCKFYIVGAPREARIISDEIIYDQPLSYVENLQYVQKSKCILEVQQENADGYTPRLWESIVYDKHLLTNNTNIVNSEYYNHQSIHLLSEMDEIGKWVNTSISNTLDLKNRLSPLHLLQKIELHFNINK